MIGSDPSLGRNNGEGHTLLEILVELEKMEIVGSHGPFLPRKKIDLALTVSSSSWDSLTGPSFGKPSTIAMARLNFFSVSVVVLDILRRVDEEEFGLAGFDG